MIEYILDEGGYKSKLSKLIKYIINNECYNCISHNQRKDGYIEIKRNGKHLIMHRYVYEIYNGEIPEGMVVMHTCDNRKCINPKHLKLGTQQDNVDDMMNKGRNKTNKGYKHTDEAKQKIRNSLIGKPQSEESILKRSQSMKGNTNRKGKKK